MPFRSSTLATAFITALLFISVTYVSCQKDDTSTGSVDTECINVDCNNGECYQGQCACFPGWEGFGCDIQTVNRYMGTWSAIETVVFSTDTNTQGDTGSYTFSIIPDGNSLLSFRIVGLMGGPDTVIATLGNATDHGYKQLEYYFTNVAMQNVNANVQSVYIPSGGGKIISSGALMDSMAYRRAYYFIDGPDSTFREETVRIATQKI